MKYLITGGTGFVGRHLTRLLIDLGHTVCITGREAQSPEVLGSYLLASDFQTLTPSELRDFDQVWHLAAVTDTLAPDDDQWNVNAHAAVEFLHHCREAGIAKPVYASSCAVYGNAPSPNREDQPSEPLNAYGAAKLAVDESVSDWAVGLRPSNVFGPGEEHKGRSSSMVCQIIANMKHKREIKLYLRCERDILHVQQAAYAFSMAHQFKPGVYNLASGNTVDYISVVAEGISQLHIIPRVTRIDCPFPKTFQTRTKISVLKLREELNRIGGVWLPTNWRFAIDQSLRAGWPNVPDDWAPLGERIAPRTLPDRTGEAGRVE